MDPIQEFSQVKLSLDNAIIPTERLWNTPSHKDGCPHDLEVDLRIVTCEYIQTAGVLLRLPQVAMATAQVLFHRFFYSKSFVKFNMIHVAMACIFLAAKIEENCRRVRDVANVFHHLKQKRMGRPVVPMDYMGEEYFKLKASIIKYERFVLKELGFCVHVKHIHKLIIAGLQILELEKNTRLVQKAWNCMNDALRTNVYVRFAPVTIACACIFLAARQLMIPLPQKPPWWTIFDVCFEDIEAICMEILALYKRPRVFMLDLEKKLTAIKEEFSKKQIEIREVKLKKKSSGTSEELPIITLSPAGDKGKAKCSSESPAFPVHSKVLPSPLSYSPRSNSPNPPITNGSKRSPKASNLTSSSPAPKRQKLSTPEGQVANRSNSDERTKPVISPIRCNDGHPTGGPVQVDLYSEESHSSGSSPLRGENGVLPKQYRDYGKHGRSHSSSKHHHHRHHRSTAKSRHDRHHHQRLDPGGGGRNSRRDRHTASKGGRRTEQQDRHR